MTAVAPVVARRAVRAADDDLLRELFLAGRPELAVLPAPIRDELVDLQRRAQRGQQEADHPAARREVLVGVDEAGDRTDCGVLVTDRDDDALYVLDIVLAPARRGHGLGSAALAGVAAEADATGREVRLHVWSDNAGARRLYERLGFEYATDADAGHLAMRRPRQGSV
ncbi:Ribosomal protein S18 acetylase RimI [Jatrophihabitans endophyticus]|uniref:Ribosomal protein S18 acetylase RimI n=1 Tax=Jatrophihabitans endophyticus TaxID=1206085 RepID=A0A1M5K972_9ACTN|nr:GNAT family N-acetyltransferase [Jatrophihabitans endophyticus]SHG49376.1 Ribosomal protein S18 acetylase RimI [Jatrophihabitans endophyticus]